MLRLGCIALTIWGGIQLIASALSLAASVVGRYAPIMKMVFTDQEIASYDPKILVVTKALATMHNTGATLLGILSLIMTWCGIHHGQKWAFWSLFAVGIIAQGMWFLADSMIGNRTVAVNIALTALFACGIILAGYGMYRT